MYPIAGNVCKKPSLTLILTRTAKSIIAARHSDDIITNKLYFKPRSNPIPPRS